MLFSSRWVRVLALCGVLMLAGTLWSWFQTRPDGRLHVVFPDLKGDSVILLTPHGQTLVFDGSSDAAGITAALGARLPFWKRSLDGFVLTSSRSQALPGSLAVARRYTIKQALIAPLALYKPQAQALADLLALQRPAVLSMPDQFMIDGVSVQVLTPASDESGMSLLVRYGSVQLLLAPQPSATDLAVFKRQQAQVLWWPWEHDADRELAEALAAQVVVYSEYPNDHWHPRSYLARGGAERRLLHEDIDGEIELITNGQTIQVRRSKGD